MNTSIKNTYEEIKHIVRSTGFENVKYIVMDLYDDVITLHDEDGDELGNVTIARIEEYFESLENN